MQAPLPEIVTWPGLTPYAEGVRRMEEAVAGVLAGGAERIFLCEHEPVLTVGSSGNAADVFGTDIPVVETGRGGKVTYHGPGQRVVYLVVDLARWGKDVRAYVRWLEAWLMASVAEFGVQAAAGSGDEIGIWVGNEKLAAIGVRVRKGVAFHGIALNVENDLAVYKTFVPCGIKDKGVTSLRALGVKADMATVDAALVRQLARLIPA